MLSGEFTRDCNLWIEANGSVTMRASAATSGAYILMFEKTSDPAYNAQKRNYVFNDSVSEKLEGMIYGASRISLVVNTLIVNSANWTFEGIGAGGTNVSGFYLSR